MSDDSTQRLLELLNANRKIEDNPEVRKGYRYVLYARKSTDDSEKQTRSLPDQISECIEFADKNELKIVKVFKEAESAKESDKRPLFREMIDGIKQNKYDGILAWHPDRLARNMKEAGEIIDLVDKRDIKDLKFVSFNFDNSASGKMHLGITFVLSKHYSDHLSDSVSRGNKKIVAEGKLPNSPRHGYYKDQNQFLLPDNITDTDNFLLIKNGFKMKLSGASLEEVAKYLNENHYSVLRKNMKQKTEKRYVYKMTKQVIAKVIKDPIYAGILWYGKNKAVDLKEIYDFKPMISVDDFIKLNRLSSDRRIKMLAKSYRKGEGIKANLMIDMVICDKCRNTMTAGITPKKTATGTTRYFYYRCDTEGCERKNKSTRAKVIMNYIYEYLGRNPFSSKGSYEHYVEEMKRVSAQRLIDARRNLRSLQSEKARLEEKIENIKDVIGGNEKEDIKDLFRKDLEPTKFGIKEKEERIIKLQAFINAGKESIFTYSEFIELIENMPKTMRSLKEMSELNYIIRKIFLNFTTDGEKVIKSTLNSPFDSIETLKVSSCASILPNPNLLSKPLNEKDHTLCARGDVDVLIRSERQPIRATPLFLKCPFQIPFCFARGNII